MTETSPISQPFGSWPSPISAEMVAAGGIGFGGVVARGQERWWSELRPSEGGRTNLVRLGLDNFSSGEPADVLPVPWSARTRVHEYGGGAWSLGAEAVYFSNWDDQRLYRLMGDGTPPLALTPEPATHHGYRFADTRETPDGRWLICVREDHTVIADEAAECVNEIVAVPTNGSEKVVVLVSGPDFVAAPRVSPDGLRLSWYQWNHPNMPWDGTELCVGTLASTTDGAISVTNELSVAGSSASGAEEAIHGSDWLSTGELMFSSDRSGYWNLYRWSPQSGEQDTITALDDAEIGGPAWVFGIQRWVELGDATLALAITRAATDSLALLDLRGALPAQPQPLDLPFVSVSSLSATGDGNLCAVVGSTGTLPRIVEVRFDDANGDLIDFTELRPAENVAIDLGWLSQPEIFDFDSTDGRQSHAFFYPPTGLGMHGSAGELPPLVVMGHGGPTSHSTPDLRLKIQYWTSRGVAVVDVNYAGSTGYGRTYRRLLNDSWGLVDVEDCVAAAQRLAEAGRVDSKRMAIRGGSAGGFTVLRALEVSDAFSAGTSLYGVADLGALASDTHKFESRYLDGLIGRYPQDKAIYNERSPINHTGDLSCPLLVMQGSEDEVVPPAQSEAIVAAVAAKGLPHAYLLFEGEQHGFRKATSIVRSLEAELWFYAQVFGFDQADAIEPIAEAVGFD